MKQVYHLEEKGLEMAVKYYIKNHLGHECTKFEMELDIREHLIGAVPVIKSITAKVEVK